MKRHDEKTNDFILRAVERFQFHSASLNHGSPAVVEAMKKMVGIEIWEMWALTQG